MKIFFGILSMIMSFVTLYGFIQAKTILDLSLAFVCLLGAIIFILFSVMEEQKETIETLRAKLMGRLT